MTACSSSPPNSTGEKTNVEVSKLALEKQLMAFHHEWQGVPYRYGGMSKQGVDCSAFVYLVYKDILGRQLPRMTEDQSNLGKEVTKGKLKAGDLVFFKTGWSTKHVGIYLGDNRFLHASTSQGVMISRLDNSYWKQKYWQSRRLWY
ncbi:MULTISPECIES: C40 family peptidase [unclassified Shewanella]|uniref:C40 family peptidase n=1 Tax=unclassified Shewanella TaxID=196818 RepID=UPI003FA3DD65